MNCYDVIFEGNAFDMELFSSLNRTILKCCLFALYFFLKNRFTKCSAIKNPICKNKIKCTILTSCLFRTIFFG